MDFRKIKSTRWLIALSLCSFFIALTGCTGQPVQLNFPLGNGNTWVYRGTTTYQNGAPQEATPPLTFRFICRQLVHNPNSPFELSLSEEGESLWSWQFLKSPKGMVNALSDELWLPQSIRVGKRWTITLDGAPVSLAVRGETSSTVPAGTFSSYLINFRGPGKDYGSFWLDPDVGILVLNWNTKTPTGQALTHLELTSYTLPQ